MFLVYVSSQRSIPRERAAGQPTGFAVFVAGFLVYSPHRVDLSTDTAHKTMIAELTDLKTRINAQERATRDDILEALNIIKAAGADRESEIRELMADVYAKPSQIDKLLSDLDSYGV